MSLEIAIEIFVAACRWQCEFGLVLKKHFSLLAIFFKSCAV